jgi:hypothetical protein
MVTFVPIDRVPIADDRRRGKVMPGVRRAGDRQQVPLRDHVIRCHDQERYQQKRRIAWLNRWYVANTTYPRRSPRAPGRQPAPAGADCVSRSLAGSFPPWGIGEQLHLYCHRPVAEEEEMEHAMLARERRGWPGPSPRAEPRSATSSAQTGLPSPWRATPQAGHSLRTISNPLPRVHPVGVDGDA